MDMVDKINKKYHGSSSGHLRPGGIIFNQINELREEHNITPEKELEIKQDLPCRANSEIINYISFLENKMNKMYNGAQHCEEEIVLALNEEKYELKEENDELKEENDELKEENDELRGELTVIKQRLNEIINNVSKVIS